MESPVEEIALDATVATGRIRLANDDELEYFGTSSNQSATLASWLNATYKWLVIRRTIRQNNAIFVYNKIV